LRPCPALVVEKQGPFLAAKSARSKVHILSRFHISGILYPDTTSGLDERKEERKEERRKEEASKYGYTTLNANCLYSVQPCQAERIKSQEVR